MLFNSLEFLIFLPIVFLLYWFVFRGRRWQNLLVVVASYVFYGWWDWRFLLLIALTSLCSYGSGRFLEHYEGQRRKQQLISALNIVLNLGILGFFKYYNFFVENLDALFGTIGWHLDWVTMNIILPVGISFYTFQALSYTIDVYQKKLPATHDIVEFFAYISFFPQLVAGPIERATNLLPQFQRQRHFDYAKAVDGMRQMLWGFLKKMVVADNCATVVNDYYPQYSELPGITLLLLGILFTIQVYCDFSGYSDIAIGVARLFGIDLMENFKSPYFSRSIKEFWSRWHISLSTWFRDYIYIPLGGSRDGVFKKNRNIMLTMLASGLWHGANWTFIIWGGLHGIYQVIEGLLRRFTGEKKDRKAGVFSNLLHWVITFILIDIAWIFFRADNFSDAFYIISHLHSGVILHFAAAWTKMLVDFGLTGIGLVKLVAPVALLVVYDYCSLRCDISTEFSKVPIYLRWPVYIILTVWVVNTSLHGGTTQSFIYFSF